MLVRASRCNPIEGGTARTAPRCHLPPSDRHSHIVPLASVPRLHSLQPLRRVDMRAANSTAGARQKHPTDEYDAMHTGVASVPSPEALKIWKEAQAVCFDVDSTLYVVLVQCLVIITPALSSGVKTSPSMNLQHSWVSGSRWQRSQQGMTPNAAVLLSKTPLQRNGWQRQVSRRACRPLEFDEPLQAASGCIPRCPSTTPVQGCVISRRFAVFDQHPVQAYQSWSQRSCVATRQCFWCLVGFVS